MHTRCNFGRSKLDLSKKLLTVPKSLWIKKIFPTFDLSLQNVSIFGKLLHYWLVHWVAWRCFGKSGHEILGRHGYGWWGKHTVSNQVILSKNSIFCLPLNAICLHSSSYLFVYELPIWLLVSEFSSRNRIFGQKCHFL